VSKAERPEARRLLCDPWGRIFHAPATKLGEAQAYLDKTIQLPMSGSGLPHGLVFVGQHEFPSGNFDLKIIRQDEYRRWWKFPVSKETEAIATIKSFGYYGAAGPRPEWLIRLPDPVLNTLEVQ
jgi:hypothetical protein